VGDKLFTGVALAEELLTQGKTYVGTMRKNKRYIPPSLIAKNRDEFSSIFAFDGNKALVSHVPEKG
jgi:Transposase IS4